HEALPLDRCMHGVEHGHSDVLLAATAGRHAAHEARAVVEALLGMKSALLAGEALADDAGMLVDEDTHALTFLFEPWAASATTFFAASVRSVAGLSARPLPASISRALSALVPCSRTTTGTATPRFFAALMMPSATRAQRTMPPKMLTRIARTLGFDRISWNASVTRSAVAPPPTSRKFAGRPPCSLIRSMVAIASPAPFTMQAMSPSSET